MKNIDKLKDKEKEKFIDTVHDYIRADYPLISLASYDEAYTDELIKKWAELRQVKKIEEWSYGRGWVDFKTKRQFSNQESPESLCNALGHILENDLQHRFIVLRDAEFAFDREPRSVFILKSLVRRIQRNNDEITIFLIYSKHEIPSALENDAIRFDVPYPDREGIELLLRNDAATVGYNLKEEDVPAIVTSLQGLGKKELQLLFNRAYSRNGNVDRDDIELFLNEREQIVRRHASLEMITVKETEDDIGGLHNLKQWLKGKGKIFSNLSDAQEFGVDTPKGVLIVGMPGCGKSLCAKVTANIFKIPLLRFDFGSVLGKYVGESDANLRRTLSLAQSISPCILWLDEFEKAFAGAGNSNSEVTTRLFGYFLTWLQENTSPIFVVATANNIDLPPEILRKGRFDETFYVTYPTREERINILNIHLKRRKSKEKFNLEVNLSASDIQHLADKMDSFTGSDIESVVKEAIELAFNNNKSILNTSYFEKAINGIKPLKTMLPDIVKKYEDMYKKYNIRPAS